MLYRKKPFFKRPFGRMLLILAGLAALGLILYQIPYFHDRLSWRLEYAGVYARSVIDPAGSVPTANPTLETMAAPTVTPTAPAETQPTAAPTEKPTAAPTAAPTATPPPLPEQ
ncbi:hypothetical protein FDZ74_02280, partial [bacterium]